MPQISSTELKELREEIFKELHHFDVRLTQTLDMINHSHLLKIQNSEIPLELENKGANSPAAYCKTPIPVSVETPWVTPKRCARPSSNETHASLPTLSNRFEGLRIYDCNPEEYDIEWPSVSAPPRRPQIVIENQKGNSSTSPPPRCPQPVNSERRKAAHRANTTRPAKVILYGDSHLNRIKGAEIKRCVPNCLPIVRSFSGATAKHLRHYVQPTLEEERPDYVIVHIGTNNITKRQHQKKPEELAREIVSIANHCRQEGAKKVFVSSILTLQRTWQVKMVQEVNFYLRLFCLENDHAFIDNDFIDQRMLWQDGIHLIDQGRDMLGTHFVNALRSVIRPPFAAWHPA